MEEECTHIGSSVCLNHIHDPKPSQSNDSDVAEDEQILFSWKCQDCGSSEQPWMCLYCGVVLCGRYINAHGIRHFANHKNHCIFINCLGLELYCYECDNFVFGDTEDYRVERLQQLLTSLNRKYKASEAEFGTEEEDEQSPHTHIGSSIENDEDSRSVPEDSPYPAFELLQDHRDGSLYGGRLRPRKRMRSRSPYVGGSERKLRHIQDDCRLRGLRNLGNTCFINSVVQALSVSDIFREYLVKLPLLEPDDDVIEYLPASPRYNTRRAAASQNGKSDDTLWASSLLAEELRKLFIQLSDTSGSYAYSPDEFLRAVWSLSHRFRGFQQQDAHDFLRVAMERIHSELRRCRIPESADNWLTSRCSVPLTPTSSAITRIFEGSLLSQVVCLTCHRASNKQETFMDLSLEIADHGDTKVSLSDCIHRFFAKEELEQREQYMCGHCMDKRPSTKQLMLSVLPTILCIHLKRFRWSHNTRGKVDTMVDFPLSGLDIRPFMTANSGDAPTFDLSSIVVHQGQGCTSGHYTAYGHRNNSWYHFNDSQVKQIPQETVLQQKAYLLFYTRSRSP